MPVPGARSRHAVTGDAAMGIGVRSSNFVVMGGGRFRCSASCGAGHGTPGAGGGCQAVDAGEVPVEPPIAHDGVASTALRHGLQALAWLIDEQGLAGAAGDRWVGVVFANARTLRALGRTSRPTLGTRVRRPRPLRTHLRDPGPDPLATCCRPEPTMLSARPRRPAGAQRLDHRCEIQGTFRGT